MESSEINYTARKETTSPEANGDSLDRALNILRKGRDRDRPRRPEEMAPPGYTDTPLDELEAIDVSDQRIERFARGYFVGKHAIGRRKDVRKVLEDKVVGKIGRKGKYLVDKLFELIEGVSIVEKMNTVNGNSEIRYYKTPPNLNAIIYALDRVLGKPKQMNVQANFSLSQLLIGNTQSTNGEFRPGNNKEDAEESDLLRLEDLGIDSAGG